MRSAALCRGWRADLSLRQAAGLIPCPPPGRRRASSPVHPAGGGPHPLSLRQAASFIPCPSGRRRASTSVPPAGGEPHPPSLRQAASLIPCPSGRRDSPANIVYTTWAGTCVSCRKPAVVQTKRPSTNAAGLDGGRAGGESAALRRRGRRRLHELGARRRGCLFRIRYARATRAVIGYPSAAPHVRRRGQPARDRRVLIKMIGGACVRSGCTGWEGAAAGFMYTASLHRIGSRIHR